MVSRPDSIIMQCFCRLFRTRKSALSFHFPAVSAERHIIREIIYIFCKSKPGCSPSHGEPTESPVHSGSFQSLWCTALCISMENTFYCRKQIFCQLLLKKADMSTFRLLLRRIYPPNLFFVIGRKYDDKSFCCLCIYHIVQHVFYLTAVEPCIRISSAAMHNIKDIIFFLSILLIITIGQINICILFS